MATVSEGRTSVLEHPALDDDGAADAAAALAPVAQPAVGAAASDALAAVAKTENGNGSAAHQRALSGDSTGEVRVATPRRRLWPRGANTNGSTGKAPPGLAASPPGRTPPKLFVEPAVPLAGSPGSRAIEFGSHGPRALARLRAAAQGGKGEASACRHGGADPRVCSLCADEQTDAVSPARDAAGAIGAVSSEERQKVVAEGVAARARAEQELLELERVIVHARAALSVRMRVMSDG